MAKGVKYVPNRNGMREMMRTREMQHLMIGHALTIAERANQIADHSIKAGVPVYDVGPKGEPVTGVVSAHAFVRTANLAAMIDNAANDTLNDAI